MRQFFLITALALGLSAISVAQTSVQRLRDIKTVYVGSFGEGEGPELIRSKIITYLVKSKQIEVLEIPDKADVVLTGASSIASHQYYNANANGTNANAHGGTRYSASAGVRLLNKDQKILWTDDVSNGFLAGSVSSSVAERISKRLLKAIAQDAKADNIPRK